MIKVHFTAYAAKLFFLALVTFPGLAQTLFSQTQEPDINRWYYLSNSFTGADKVLSSDGSVVSLVDRASSAEQQWRFVPFTQGYYRIINRANPTRVLDTINDLGNSEQIRTSDFQNITGQAWKLTPQSQNRVSLSTQWLGDSLHLDVINNGINDKVRLADAGPFSGQRWTLTEATPWQVFAESASDDTGWIYGWQEWVYVLNAPWFYNLKEAFWFYVADSSVDDGMWFYRPDLEDWRWTGAVFWPLSFSTNLEDWLDESSPDRSRAYAWASEPTTLSYDAVGRYSYSSVGGKTKIERTDVGRYTVTLKGMGKRSEDSGGNVQVTPYGFTPATATVANWGNSSGDLEVRVALSDANGQPVDGRFSVLFTRAKAGSAQSYAWANSPSMESYTPSEIYAHNLSGGEILAQNQSTGTTVWDLAVGEERVVPHRVGTSR